MLYRKDVVVKEIGRNNEEEIFNLTFQKGGCKRS